MPSEASRLPLSSRVPFRGVLSGARSLLVVRLETAACSRTGFCWCSRTRRRPTRPAFVSAVPGWNVGDTFEAGGRRFRILEISSREMAEVTAHAFEAVWTVEELPG
jgi:hypothetical protein